MLNTQSTLSPIMEKGRADARELMATGARLVRKAADTKKADASATLSTSLQLVLTTALVDGFEPHEVYDALAGALAWSVMRLERTEQMGVLLEMVKNVIEKAGLDQSSDAAQSAPIN